MEEVVKLQSKGLSIKEAYQVLAIKSDCKCDLEAAYEIWNEDTTRYENGE
jgi:hypothetical protein